MVEGRSRIAKVGGLWSASWIAVAAAAVFLTGTSNDAAGSSLQPAPKATNPQFSAAEISALHRGAEQHPFATLAVLYLLRDGSAAQEGALYLQCIPPSKLTSLLLDSPDQGAIATLLGTLQWSPYYFSEYFVQVSWKVRYRSADEQVIEFRTQLLNQAGTFRHPALETNTTVLLRSGGAWFLVAAMAM